MRTYFMNAASMALAILGIAMPSPTSLQAGDLLEKARLGPLKEVQFVIFANRLSYEDPHWYANIGYYGNDEQHMAYAGNGKPDVGRLCRLDLETGQVKALVDAEGGSIRDPIVHYDAHKILFSWRKQDSIYYNLHELDLHTQTITPITSGPFDDYEPTYLPNDDIVFVSTRCNRWVNCWKTQVGTLFRLHLKDHTLDTLSSNIEHDNTPSILPDGRILYTRWEYVDRSQVGYHHLWTVNPDGTGQMVYYGNQRHYPLFIAAKPIPHSDKVVGVDSPGHGQRDHYGYISLFDPHYGPDDPRGLERISKQTMMDPYPLSEDWFLTTRGHQVLLLHRSGDTEVLHQSEHNCYEPSAILPRSREPYLPSRTRPSDARNGAFLVSDIYQGRSMEGLERGTVKKLLILESLPKPVSFSGGPDLLSWLGTFTLERVLGTVPVEEDGSAFFEAPADRPLFFVALGEKDASIKRMQSFVSVRPGEVSSCVGCHDSRTETPSYHPVSTTQATQRPPSPIKPFAGFPDVMDFNRDIQPILDRHCVACHNPARPEGGVLLDYALGPQWSLSYFTLFARQQVADGRNGLGGQPLHSIGAAASPLMNKVEGHHYGVRVSEDEWRTLWLWIESAAPYAGSYAALRNDEEMGLAGGSARVFWTEKPRLTRRCGSCHDNHIAPQIPFHTPDYPDSRGIDRPIARHERLVIDNDPLARFSAHVMLNLTHPERSTLLLAPLSKAAGGWGRCGEVFTTTEDPDYQRLLASVHAGKQAVDAIPRYSTPDFRPNRQYLREMKKYGILPAQFSPEREAIDVFEVDQRYWQSFW